MEKLFEIVSSFIPDEQKDDIKSKIDGELSNLIKGRDVELKKEMSGKYGVDFFEEDVNKAFTNKTFVKKDIYEERQSRVLELETENNELKESQTSLKTNSLINETSIGLLANGFNPERIDSAKPLINTSESKEENVERIKLAFPELFKVQTVRKDMNPDKTQEGKKTSEAERFFTQQKEKRK